MSYIWSKRRYLSFVFLLAFLLFIFPSPTVSGAGSTDTLKPGVSGSRVLQLQKDLKALGFFKVTPTGFYGDITKTAVLSFQKKHDIPTTGMAGPITLTRIDALLKRNGAVKSSVKIVVDAGHGGIDPGTSKGNVVEKEVNLNIAKMLQSYLEEENHKVIMTRTTDTSLYKLSKTGNTTQLRDLNARVNIINSSNAKLFVSVHVNSLPEDPGMSGSIVYYNSKSSSSKTLALSIQKALNSITADGKQRKKNSIRTANFYLLKNSNIPGVLVETAFVTNKTERALLSQKSFREKLAKAIFTGMENSGLLK